MKKKRKKKNITANASFFRLRISPLYILHCCTCIHSRLILSICRIMDSETWYLGICTADLHCFVHYYSKVVVALWMPLSYREQNYPNYFSSKQAIVPHHCHCFEMPTPTPLTATASELSGRGCIIRSQLLWEAPPPGE